MISEPKYSHSEIERRWIVYETSILPLQNVRARAVEDKYLSAGRLRFRRVNERGHATIFKLGKKYGRTSEGVEPVVTVYLTEAEYNVLLNLPGSVTSKVRYSVQGGALDVYEQPNHGFAIFEMEFSSSKAAAEYAPPCFVGQEVTSSEEYSGFALSEDREGGERRVDE